MTTRPRRAASIAWLAGWGSVGLWLCWLGTGSLVVAAIGGLSGCGVAVVSSRRRQRTLRRRRAEQITAALPDVLELLAATVDGGAAPDLAVKRVAAFATEPLRSVLIEAIEAAAGVGLGASMRAADPALRPLGSLFQQSEELGVPIAGALRLLAADARLQARAAALLIVIGGQALVLRSLIGPVMG